MVFDRTYVRWRLAGCQIDRPHAMALLKLIAEEHAIIPKLTHFAKLKDIPEHLLPRFNFNPSFPQVFRGIFWGTDRQRRCTSTGRLYYSQDSQRRRSLSFLFTPWIFWYVHAINETNRNYFNIQGVFLLSFCVCLWIAVRLNHRFQCILRPSRDDIVLTKVEGNISFKLKWDAPMNENSGENGCFSKGR